MTAMIWRIVIAVIVVVILNALIGPVSRLLGFPASGDLLTILRVCMAGLAVLYIIKGPPFPA